MAPEILIALVGVAALIAYALLGGADFGAGVWDLLARGPRAEAQRSAIAQAMGPVWEANHVWLIFLIVLLFSCFPPAFAALSVALFVPFHLALLGIVLRGAAFVFRSYGDARSDATRLWTRIFGISSTITPVLLGMCLGAVASGRIRLQDGQVISDPWSPWLGAFSWCLGALGLAICAYVTAIYLTLETEGATREDFRQKGLRAGGVLVGLALLTLAAARFEAPTFFARITAPEAAPVLLGAAGLAGVSAWALHRRRYAIARTATVAQVSLVVLGWAVAQQPYLIYPHFTLAQAASPDPTLRFVLWSLVPGTLLLLPSLALLFTVFKGETLRPRV